MPERHIRDLLDAEEVRAINAAEYDSTREYLRSGPTGGDAPDKVRQRIRNVRRSSIKKLLDAMPPFHTQGTGGDHEAMTDDEVKDRWVDWMVLVAGRHLFPDANHRTAHLSFQQVLRRGWGMELEWSAESARATIRASKRFRDPRRLGRRRARYDSVAELMDQRHPYRDVYRSAARDLRVVRPGPS